MAIPDGYFMAMGRCHLHFSPANSLRVMALIRSNDVLSNMSASTTDSVPYIASTGSAEAVERMAGKSAKLLAQNINSTARGASQPSDQMQKRALARA